jgi:hypothetical protein
MRDTESKRRILLGATAVLALGLWTPCMASPIWLDESFGGDGYAEFGELADAYNEFVGQPTELITFNDLPAATTLLDQYAGRFGVTFANTARGRYARISTTHAEGDADVGNLTGYDGSYMPDGDTVVVKFDNDRAPQPFTIFFDEPVTSVGAFLAMGVQGSVHSLTITVYDPNGEWLTEHNAESWLWENDSSGQNYETFFAVRADGPEIGRVEILNDSPTDFASALMIDNVAFSRGLMPEPTVTMFLAIGAALLLLGRGVLQQRT